MASKPTSPTGLTAAEAAALLKAEGYNELPAARRRTWLRIVREIVREPMFGLLLGAGVIYLILGDLEEALVLLVFATLSVSIAVIQESRSERVLEALRDLTSPRALVVRDGEQRRIPGREVVRGDLILLAEGDRVPADAVLISGHQLRVDESLLTGESVPVRKTIAADDASVAPRPGGDDLPYVFSGTLVVAGSGNAVVRATGVRSEIGKIGSALTEIETAAPRLQRQTRRLVAAFAVVGGAISAVAVILYGTLRGGWLDALLGGIALGMSMLPEEFPLVLTVFMVMGAWRISRANVLTRRATAIETLGAATVLCTDKTGTLTQNRMSIAEIETLSDRWRAGGGELPHHLRPVLEAGVLASAREALDPMDRAFHDLAARRLQPGDLERIYGDRALIHAFGISSDLLAVVNLWRSPADGQGVAAAKGAPEAIAELCRLDAQAVADLRSRVDAMAGQGMRVLAIASAPMSGAAIPSSPRALPFEFVGLVGFADPLRPTVPAAVRECRNAGVRVIMITGDYPVTARAIAREAGLASEDVITGEELERLDDDALKERIKTAAVFARVLPEQKLRIVNALKADGEIVAMTGDGVNDAPSLKAADIGIAMGARGTDVAREASSIVLLDDDFGSIVRTIRLGRRVYDNLRKAMGYVLAVHVPIAGIALLPLIIDQPLVLTPMLIAFLEMVIDPMCSVVLEAEPEERDVMSRPPRDPGALLLSRSLITWSLVQGTLALVTVAGIYVAMLRRGMPADEVRALSFVSLVTTNMALIFANRSFGASLIEAVARRNPSLWLGLGMASLLIGVTLLWSPVRSLFRLGPFHAEDLAICLGAGVLLLIALELIKIILGSRLRS